MMMAKINLILAIFYLDIRNLGTKKPLQSGSLFKLVRSERFELPTP